MTESLEVQDAKDPTKHLKIIQDYISWGWDVTLGKQPWNPASKNKLAYLSSMCRYKSARAEAQFLPNSLGNNIYKTLLKSEIPMEYVSMWPAPLAETAPFGQVNLTNGF